MMLRSGGGVLAIVVAVVVVGVGVGGGNPGLQGAGASAPCALLPAGNAGWWPLDELAGATVVTDIVGAHNGVPFPGGQVSPISGNPMGPSPGAISPSGAVVGGSLYFYRLDGTMFVEAPHHQSLDMEKHSFTIDAWVFPAEFSEDNFLPIVDKFDSATNIGYAFYVQSVGMDDNLFLKFTYGDGSQLTTVTSDPPKLTYTAWTHVAVIVDRLAGGQLDIRMYVNGVQQSSQPLLPAPATSVANTQDLLIGGTRMIPALPAGVHLGEVGLDEIEIFGSAISPAAVQAIHAAGPAGKCRVGPRLLFEGWNEIDSWDGSPLEGVDHLLGFFDAYVDPPVWLSVAHYDGDGWLQAFADAPLPAFNTLTEVQAGEDYWLFVMEEAELRYPE